MTRFRRRYAAAHRPARRPAPIVLALVAAAVLAAVGAIALSPGSPGRPGAAAVPGVLPRPGATAIATTPRGDPTASPGAGPGAVAGGPRPDPTPASSPEPGPVTTPGVAAGARFPDGLLIADRGNGRLLVVNAAGRILWRFPVAGSLPRGQAFAADDAFVAPDGRTIVANDETHQVIDRIDIATRRVVWQYGHYALASSRIGYLHNPDDAYPLANGDVIVADIVNCRILEITPAKHVARMFGRTGACVDRAPYTYGAPNGDTPLPDGGLLITEIRGSRVVRLSPTGKVLFDVHVPARYPSDAQVDAHGNVIVADYSNPGAVMAVSPKGRLLWRYAPASGRGRLDHPSLATPLADGTIAINDDFRQRIVVLDPRTMRIVWQYGRTDVAGRRAGDLFIPDGHQPVPPGTAF